jgi:hypothetical protein
MSNHTCENENCLITFTELCNKNFNDFSKENFFNNDTTVFENIFKNSILNKFIDLLKSMNCTTQFITLHEFIKKIYEETLDMFKFQQKYYAFKGENLKRRCLEYPKQLLITALKMIFSSSQKNFRFNKRLAYLLVPEKDKFKRIYVDSDYNSFGNELIGRAKRICSRDEKPYSKSYVNNLSEKGEANLIEVELKESAIKDIDDKKINGTTIEFKEFVSEIIHEKINSDVNENSSQSICLIDSETQSNSGNSSEILSEEIDLLDINNKKITKSKVEIDLVDESDDEKSYNQDLNVYSITKLFFFDEETDKKMFLKLLHFRTFTINLNDERTDDHYNDFFIYLDEKINKLKNVPCLENPDVIVHSSDTISLKNFISLKPKEKLYDSIIDCYMLLLNLNEQFQYDQYVKTLGLKYQTKLFLNTKFWDESNDNKKKKRILKHVKYIFPSNQINRFLKVKEFGLSYNEIYIPIYVKNCSHWICAQVLMNTKEIVIVDSCDLDFSNTILKDLKEFFIFYTDYKYDWKATNLSKDFPIQENGYDCGVHTLMNIRTLCNGKNKLSIKMNDVRHFRAEIAISLLLGKIQ